MVKARDEATWFSTPTEWRSWLESNHDSITEIWLGLRKKHVTTGISYKEALDEALCFGWIDGLTHSVDADGYTIRFTPRKAKSTWSAVNLKRIDELIAEGRLHESGRRAFEERDPAKAGLYSFEQDEVAFPEEFAAQFQANAPAWAWFQARTASYRHRATWWVISAKRPETRERRLATLIEDSANERPLKQFAP